MCPDQPLFLAWRSWPIIHEHTQTVPPPGLCHSVSRPEASADALTPRASVAGPLPVSPLVSLPAAGVPLALSPWLLVPLVVVTSGAGSRRGGGGLVNVGPRAGGAGGIW